MWLDILSTTYMLKKKVKRIKKSSVWNVFSKYIRLRDCINTTGDPEYLLCVTCHERKHLKDAQAGHFIPGRHNSVLFDERNVHGQCMMCNIFLKGNPIKYYRFMITRYGQSVIDELESLDSVPKQLKNFELLELRDKYKSKLKALEIA